jgi:hypothetical protein
MFHLPIPILPSNKCPECGEIIEPYGQVDVAPIWTQIMDMKFGYRREYLADRHCCDECNLLFDVMVRTVAVKDNNENQSVETI